MTNFVKEHLNINKLPINEVFLNNYDIVHFNSGIVIGLFIKYILPEIVKFSKELYTPEKKGIIEEQKLSKSTILLLVLLASVIFEIIENVDANLGDNILYNETHPEYSGDNPIDSQMDNLYVFLGGLLSISFKNYLIPIIILLINDIYLTLLKWRETHGSFFNWLFNRQLKKLI